MREAELPRHQVPAQRQRAAGEGAGAKWHLIGGLIRVPESLGVAQQRLGVGEQVMPDRHRLSTLQVCVPRHRPRGVRGGLHGEALDRVTDRCDPCRRRRPAVKAKVERHLVVARPAGVQVSTGRRDFGQTSLNGRVNVLVRVRELERAVVELAIDLAQATLNSPQLGGFDDAGGRQASRMREAAGDVEGV